MNFRNPFVIVCLLFSSALLVPATNAAEKEVQAERIAEGIYVLSPFGGNIGVVIGADGIFLIDDQVAPVTEAVRAKLDTLPGGEDAKVRFVLNTHFHADHTGGNENLGKAGAVIVAHDNVRAEMTTDDFRKGFIDNGGKDLEDALPIVTFSDRVTFHVNGRTLVTRHYPHAHTDGDSVVWFEEDNIVHMGDIYFQAGYPYIDLEHGGSIDGAIAAVDSVLADADEKTIVIPGHGAVSDKKGLRAYRDMLADLREKVAAAIDAGKSLDEIKAMMLSKEYDERWSWNFINGERFIETIHASLADANRHHGNHH
ncbi:MAG TPA: MBL fold metallo-hydrolase [Gammaproteobacteria bacterium]